MWPFTQSDPPSLETIQRKKEVVEHLLKRQKEYAPDLILNENFTEKDLADLGRAYNQYATALRDTDQGEEALEYCTKAIAIWKELGRDKAVIVAEILRCSILTRIGQFDQAMRLIETLLRETDENETYQPYLDTMLLHRAAIFLMYGDTSLATKDLDHALLVRKDRTQTIDTSILDYRNNILLNEEDPAQY